MWYWKPDPAVAKWLARYLVFVGLLFVAIFIREVIKHPNRLGSYLRAGIIPCAAVVAIVLLAVLLSHLTRR